MNWIKARDHLPETSGYYLICALPGNWREIRDADAIDYLKSNHGRRLAWFHNGVFWESDQPSKSSVASNYVVVYWSKLPSAPNDPEIDPLSEGREMWTDSMRTDHEKVMWLTALARRYVQPDVLTEDPQRMPVADLARVLFDALGIA